MRRVLLAALVGMLPMAALADTTISGPITFTSPSTTVSGSKVSVPTATTLVTGLVKPDGSTITISGGIITAASTAINGTSCTPGGSCTITAAATAIAVGTTTVSGGTTGRVLYDNSGVLGEMTTTGTGTVLALANSPVLVTPTLGDATATTVNKLTLTPPASGATLTIADGKTLTDTSGVGAVALKGATGGGFAQAASTDLSDSAGLARLGSAESFTAAQRGTPTNIAISTATFTPNFNTGQNFEVDLTSACPCTLANPSTTLVAGQSGMIEVHQDGSGSRTIGTWGSDYQYVGGTSTITLSTAASAIDYLPYYVRNDATTIVLGAILKAPAH